MKKNIKIFSLVAVPLFSFLVIGGINKPNNYRPIRKVQSFSYKINIKDSKSFSYENIEGDESVGPEGIVIAGNNIFISDPDHSNIKKICLKSGAITNVSRSIYSRNFLFDIAYFNGYIYMIPPGTNEVTNIDTGFVQSNKLQLTKDIAPFPYLLSTADSLLIESDNKYKSDGGGVLKEFFSLNKQGQWNLVTKNIPFSVYQSNKSRGRSFSIKNESDKIFFQNDFGVYELNCQIPTIKTYSCNSVDFDKDHIVYYSFDSKFTNLILTIYSY